MTLYGTIFYILAAALVLTTALAVTRRHPVHAIVYLVLSFWASALLFYLLGAPLLAAFEIIIYAGAVMVLFLFVVMMLKLGKLPESRFSVAQWVPAGLLGLLFLVVGALAVLTDPQAGVGLQAARAAPQGLGRFVFEKYWLSVEMISLLLLVALVAAIQIGKGRGKRNAEAISGDVKS
jgi:NADH-quinone oxidoreductase subunit J